MKITTKNKTLRKALANQRDGVRLFGADRARVLERRIGQLDVIERLGDLWPPNSGPERCHELTGGRSGVFSVDLTQPYRLLFKPISDEQKGAYRDDKTWWNSIEAIELLDVENTHE